MMRKQQLNASTWLLLACTPLAQAMPLLQSADTELNLTLQGAIGAYHSQRGYAQTAQSPQGSVSWQEATLQYGLQASHRLAGAGSLYGAFDWVSSATFGDGDAAGWTLGDERTTKPENAYLGWRSGDLFESLGQDGIDVSAGRQNIVVGDGFLLSGDALNLGNGLLDGATNRGGAYYLTGRKAFDRTLVLRLGGHQGWRGDLMWLKSDNPAQARPELQVATLEHVAAAGTLGLTWVKVNDTDAQLADALFADRAGTRTLSVRGQGNAGVDNLLLAAEHAWQRSAGRQESAWYAEAGWTFAQWPGQPRVNLRHSRFSQGYDPLFYGNGRALGTWFQGEVAANYAGPFNTNTEVEHLGLKISPAANLDLGALLYSFRTLDTSRGKRDATEADLYAEWRIDPHWTLMPLVGWYKPRQDTQDGGSQWGGTHSNLYAQLLLAWNC